jgi:dipeptidyl-peptidase III
MDAAELKHYLADAPPTIVRLEIEKHFEPLSDKQKRYAHFISRYGTRPQLRVATHL